MQKRYFLIINYNIVPTSLTMKKPQNEQSVSRYPSYMTD